MRSCSMAVFLKVEMDRAGQLNRCESTYQAGEDQQRSGVQRGAGALDPAAVEADVPGGDHGLCDTAGAGEAEIP